jgi:hypothetical protein
MTPTEREALHALLAQMRALHEQLTQHDAGVCVLHLEAAIAALESHLARDGRSPLAELRQGLALRQASR